MTIIHLIAGLPGLHGLLIATLGIIHYRQTKGGKKRLIAELICACLLILAWLLIVANVWLEWQSLVSSVCGLWLAAIATFVLNIVAIAKTIKAFRNKNNWVLSTVGVLLNLVALLIYLLFALWLGWLLVLMLLDAPYR